MNRANAARAPPNAGAASADAPARGDAALGHLGRDPHMVGDTAFGPAERSRLQQTVSAGVAERGRDRSRQLPVLVGLSGPFGQGRHKRADPIENRLWIQRRWPMPPGVER